MVECKAKSCSNSSNYSWNNYCSYNEKGSEIKLIDELKETEDKFGYTSACHWRANEMERQYLQEVSSKQECKIM
jgi:hypothetical protein